MKRNHIACKLAMAAVAILLTAIHPSMNAQAATGYQNEFLSLINAKRADNGLAPVTLDDSILSDAADTRAEELTKKFSYQRPDGRREFTVLDDEGITDEFVGECYSAGQDSPKESLRNMMEYDFFENKILSKDAVSVGIGHYSGGVYGNYWDVIFTSPEVTDTTALAQEVLDLVNIERANNGLEPLVLGDEKLNAAAQKRAEEIAVVTSHTRPDGTSCFTIMDEFGITDAATGENAAWGQTSAEEVVRDWMNSEGHRANILNPDAKKMGVGYYCSNSSEWGYQWIQIFTE